MITSAIKIHKTMVAIWSQCMGHISENEHVSYAERTQCTNIMKNITKECSEFASKWSAQGDNSS